jgi:glutamate-1-semialdehyde aminotransferase
MSKSQELYRKAKKIIPGGTQFLSKRPEMFLPDLWPTYYEKAKGCTVWDLDGRKFIDMSYMGIGACTLGYADKDVDNAVKKAISKGSMTTLNCFEEIKLAELLCKIHPWADMVRYARTGGEAMAIAVRIARAKTGKDVILFCGYHGWHDWYLSANLASSKSLDDHLLPGLKSRGVPRGLKKTAIPFNYNDTNSFLKLINKYKNNIAAVVMEPIRNHHPKNGFLETIRRITKKFSIVLVFDEVTSGWRLNLGGAHLNFRVNPDIAVFGKGMSNGYPMAGTERIGPTAALATINKLREKKVPKHLINIGREVKRGWKRAAEKNHLNITVSGIPPLAHFSFNYKNPLILKTLFTQLMLEKGFLATDSLYSSYAHKEKYVGKYLRAVDQSFYIIKKAINKGNPKKYLRGPICHSGFKRLT